MSWAKQTISNITTSKYTFNGFITALKKSLQLEEEIMDPNKSLDTRSVEEETIYQRYARDPKLVRKYQPRNIGTEPPRFSPFSRKFKESRRRNECQKCRASWKPGHRHRPRAVREHVRQYMRSGEAAIHIVSGSVLPMEKKHRTTLSYTIRNFLIPNHNIKRKKFAYLKSE